MTAPPRLKDLKDRRFGRLVVIHFSRMVGTVSMWICKCDCGTEEHEVRRTALISGKTESCGCLRWLHGESGNSLTTEFNAWIGMRGRHMPYVPEWERYTNFLRDMGRRPEKTWLRRKDTSKPYGPDNCFWGPRGGRRKKG